MSSRRAASVSSIAAARAAPPAGEPLAVIDIGSNSSRVVVVRLSQEGHLELVAGARASLRLAREVRGGVLPPEAIERILEALRDFMAVARGAGAASTVAVATAAVRDAENAAALVGRIRDQLGVDVEVIDGLSESAYGFIGAVHGLPVDGGVLFDIGGGSLEVASFGGRELGRAWSLPLGALRLSDRFLRSDPPAPSEIEALAKHVRRAVAGAKVPALGAGERLVGTGGTVRNLAGIDQRKRRYAIPHLHGYELALRNVRDITESLAGRRLVKRRATRGLNADRADSIVGGAYAVLAIMEATGAEALLVSGQGLREGVALATLGADGADPAAIRAASIRALARRFATWDPDAAARRRDLALALAAELDPAAAPELLESITHAAVALDLGRAVDYYDRHGHTADVLLSADLAGFTHRQLAVLAEICREAGGDDAGGAHGQLLQRHERALVSRAAVILAIADEIEARTPPDEPVQVTCRVRKGSVTIESAAIAAWRPRGLPARFRRAFRRKLVLGAGE